MDIVFSIIGFLITFFVILICILGILFCIVFLIDCIKNQIRLTKKLKEELLKIVSQLEVE